MDNADNNASTGSSENSEKKPEFWAGVSMVAVTPVAIAAGLAKGVYDASTDHGPFADGFTDAATSIMRAGRKFGEEHGQLITRGVVGGAAGAAGARILHTGLRHLRL